MIGDAALAFEGDGDGLLRLFVVERLHDKGVQGGHAIGGRRRIVGRGEVSQLNSNLDDHPARERIAHTRCFIFAMPEGVRLPQQGCRSWIRAKSQ